LLSSACRNGVRLRLQRRRARARRRAERGFTLVEALVAIVILALSLGALLSAHDGGLRGATAIDEHLRARLLAQSLLAQWSQHRVIPQGPFQGRSGRLAWTVSIAPFTRAGGRLQQEPDHWMLHEVTVTVAWPPGRQIQLNTLRLLQAR
jgi:general secretion pathway protein I